METSIGFELRALISLIKKRMGDNFKISDFDENITPMHGWVINYLLENKNKEIFQKDIENILSIEGSTATKIIQLMEKKELITRESVEYDSRLKRVKLTDKAMNKCEFFVKKMKSIEKELLKDISEKDLVIFYKVIQKMKENISE